LRPIGGGIDFGELAVEAVVREVKEELGMEVLEPVLVQVLEHPDKFAHVGDPRHEVIFLFRAGLKTPGIFELKEVALDDGGKISVARWFSLEDLLRNPPARLEPPALARVLAELTD